MFEKPSIDIVEQSSDLRFARLVCEPLERGYGTTLGNSLRRIMLSTLEGYAVSQIKIDGVLHEFSTIDGVKEDVTEIVMNIKDLAIKNNSNVYEQKIATLSYEGEGIVTAGDIKVDSDVEIVNKDLIIAHLSGKHAKLNMSLVITPGRGYVSAEKNKENLMGAGYIAIDSIYDPVKRVNMKVENTRVGNQTDYDKLTLEVKTDGTMSAKEAVSYAAKVLLDHVQLFVDLSNIGDGPTIIKNNPEVVKGSDGLREKSILDLDLTVRAYNSLKRSGINTIGDLLSRTPTEIAQIRNLGKKSYDELILKLADKGLQLNIDKDE
ncbi:MAG: DNA-directed RNA polymerase subunit alpha [Lachnospiraceae bacterium]|nr:DNA-directed RNA polymerase subunit alpha [Lachnospiraceae bacterium]MBR1844714.1 DNA-directed RNA polymerase subunit alpha [Lachnospiraceae bacterium]